MVWTTLILTGPLACVASAMLAARDARLGPEGYAILMAIAGVVGVANAWAVNKACAIVMRRAEDFSKQARERHARLLFLAVCVWYFMLPFLILGAASHLLH